MSSCVIDRSHGSPMFLFYKNEAAIFRCNACGCIMADVPFVAGHYDDEDYYTMRKHSIEDIQAEWGFRWRYILQRSRRYVKRQTNNSNTLLDVGAGNGYFVYLAEKEYSYASNGVEISRHQVEFAKTRVQLLEHLSSLHQKSGQ